ncbi:LysM peptidoglycan-binding domain-containing protein [Pseudoalteromonas xiamenensis]
MRLPLSGLLLATCVAFGVQAEQLQIKPDAPAQYVVKKGDTLWDISNLYLSSPWLWPKLWSWNPQVKNPNLIYPGNVLALVYDANGQPQLQLVKGVVKLSPSVRVIEKNQIAIPTLPLSVIEPYLTHEVALTEADIDMHPIILGSNRNVKINTLDQLLYVKGNVVNNALYGIYRKGDDYKELESQQTLATEMRLVATARGIRSGDIANGTPGTVYVEEVKQEIRAGDRLIPLNTFANYSAQFKMSRPSTAMTGQIIATNNQLREFSSMSVVVLNVGKAQQVQEGFMFDIKRQSPTVIEGHSGPRYVEDANSLEKLIKATSEFFGDDNSEGSTVWTMPKEKVGELMVFRVFDKVSYALVTKTSEPLRIGDFVEALPN